MNKVFLTGNLTRDPEVRYTQTGKATARMGIAVKRPYSKENAVDFFNLQAWNQTAEFCQRYLTKGTRILVEGRMQNYTYEAKDGTTKSGIDIVVENIEFAGARRDTNSGDEFGGRRNNYSGNNSTSRQNSEADFDGDFVGEDVSDEDVPF